MTRPKLGFVGVGWIGQHRMKAIVEANVCDVLAIYDPARELAEKARELAPGATIVSSYDQLLDLGCDGVVIATPSALHADQSIQALQRGAAVFCQKPLARNANETRLVLDAARRADRLIAVDLSYRYTAAMRAVRELVSSGQLGRVFAVDLVFHNAYGPDKAWFYDPSQSGGGCLMDLGIHMVDLLLWTLESPGVTEVWSRLFHAGSRLETREKVEDYAAARIDLAGGVTAQLACSWRLSAGCEAVIEASFYGTEGSASFRNVNGSFYDFVADKRVGTQTQRLVEPPDEWGGRAAVDFATRLAASPQFDASAEHLLEVAAVLDRIYETARRPAEALSR